MTKDDAKFAHSLLTLYSNLYLDKYSKAVTVNRHREKWAMVDVIDSIGYERAKTLLVYYFQCNKPGHPLQWFYFNFDKLDEMLKKIEEDKDKRAKMRTATKRMMEGQA
jgi:hypothetical protein